MDDKEREELSERFTKERKDKSKDKSKDPSFIRQYWKEIILLIILINMIAIILGLPSQQQQQCINTGYSSCQTTTTTG